VAEPTLYERLGGNFAIAAVVDLPVSVLARVDLKGGGNLA
jgi:hypothetical protein